MPSLMQKVNVSLDQAELCYRRFYFLKWMPPDPMQLDLDWIIQMIQHERHRSYFERNNG